MGEHKAMMFVYEVVDSGGAFYRTAVVAYTQKRALEIVERQYPGAMSITLRGQQEMVLR